MFDTLESWIKFGMVRRARKLRRRNSSQGSLSSTSDLEKADMKGAPACFCFLSSLPSCATGGDARLSWQQACALPALPTPAPHLLTPVPTPLVPRSRLRG